jgi:sugar-specific transcriptional regulator TrmB
MKDKLREFGFSEKEAAVYVALAGLSGAVASDIAKKAKINRSTTYVILDMLLKRGLVTSSEERGIKVYRSTPPEKLIEYLHGMEKEYASLASAAKKIIPELKALYRPKKDLPKEALPKIQLLEGEREIRTVYEDTLSSLENIRAYASVEAPQKSKKESKVQVIFPDTPEAKTKIADVKGESEEAFRIPSPGYGFSSEINIYDKKVIFISPTEKFGIIIESAEFADFFKKILKNRS